MTRCFTATKRRSLTIVLVGMLLLAGGCGPSSLTKANFDKLKQGMKYQEIEAILGKPTETVEKKAESPAPKAEGLVPFKMCRWGDRNRFVLVGFSSDDTAGIITQKGLE